MPLRTEQIAAPSLAPTPSPGASTRESTRGIYSTAPLALQELHARDVADAAGRIDPRDLVYELRWRAAALDRELQVRPRRVA